MLEFHYGTKVGVGNCDEVQNQNRKSSEFGEERGGEQIDRGFCRSRRGKELAAPHAAPAIELSLSSPLSGRKIVTASAKLFLPN